MRLTLEVISANGDALGSNRSKTIGPEGAQIGRSKESDWVINDPYISRIHARIRFVNGTYYVEGTGRNPLALNDPSNVVANNQPQLLRTGDRFFLDQYEIRVAIEGGNERKPPPDPLPQESDSPTVRVPPVAVVQQSRQPEVVAQADEDASLDPLAILSNNRAPVQPAPHPARSINLDPGPAHEQAFSPPPVRAPLQPNEPTPLPISANTQKLPDEYRPPQAHSAHSNAAPLHPVEPTTRKPAPTPSAQNGTTARSGKGVANGWPGPFSPNDPAQGASPTTPLQVGLPPLERQEPRTSPYERHEPRVHVPERVEVRPTVEPRNPPFERAEPRVGPFERVDPRVNPGVSKTINRAMPSSSPAHAPLLEPAAPVRETRSASLEQLLAAAGVRESQMAPELAQELGEVLRVVVQGVMEVLQSRAEIKSQLRMSMTLMKPAENNPLKFSPNVEAALHTLLVERNRGYLPTVRAFQEALIDIRHHQIAVLQGIRSAFHAMLEQFNPVRLEQEFERHGAKRGLLNVGSKSRFRDAYVEEFERLTRDPDDSFKRLFGEYFAQAYEDQMDQLKTAARNEGR